MKQLLLAVLLATATAHAGDSAPVLNIDPNRITVSGISSGAHMAHQLHIAYSDLFSGAALLSGGPFNCAENSMITAMGRCMANTDEALPVAEMAAGIRAAAQQGKLADPELLADDRVWLFHGTRDSTISAEVHDAAAELYAEFIPAEHIRRVNDIPAGHFFPASGSGHACTDMQPPFVGDCEYDAAGALLSFLYPGLSAPRKPALAAIEEVVLPGADDADLMETAYLYVPSGCAVGEPACALHLVLHGCAQSAETVGTGFIEQSGYLPWAEANRIVLAFPQVEKSLVAPLNPHACWDWWGYTGDDYLWRSGKQMNVLTGWIQRLRGATGL
jgi:poly(3-hydroxybutyrate) depolymerase